MDGWSVSKRTDGKVINSNHQKNRTQQPQCSYELRSDNMTDYKDKLNTAYQAALDRYQMIMEEAFPAQSILTTHSTSDFVALARPMKNGVEIVVSKGVVDDVTVLWQKVIKLSDSMPEGTQLNVLNVDDAIDASLMWLILHELHHEQIGHLELIGPAGISETALKAELGLTSRSAAKPSALDGMTKVKSHAIKRCLELQADHDALEIILDHYSDQGWEYVRFYMAAAMAMMVLIDQQDEADDDDRTHPYAETRAFQLVGILSQLWKPTSTSDWEQPDDDEIQKFYEEVVVPSVADFFVIATAAGQSNIVQSWDDVDAFFDDILLLQDPDNPDLNNLKTKGAREYASLALTNQEAIELLGPEKFFT